MNITFVTTNKGKADSLRRVFEPRGIEIEQVELDLPELQVTSVQEIAEHKARYAYKELRQPVVVQDAGFYLHAWNGFPGPFTKFALQTLELDGFLHLVQDRDRSCEFRECLAYFDGSEVHCFEAVVPGELSTEARGAWTSDAPTQLWKLFIPAGHTQTLAEMTSEERDGWRRVRPKNYGDLFCEWYFGTEGPGAA